MQRAPAAAAKRNLLTLALKTVLVGGAYYLAARLGLRVALIERNVTPLWPPTGIAVVAFLLLGRGVWPGVSLAAFLVNLPITPHPLAAAATAAGNTLAPFAAAELLRAADFRKEIDRLRDAAAIVAAALLGMLISATIGTWTLQLSDVISADRFASAWAVWWTGDAMGVLVVAPFLLSLFLFRRKHGVAWGRVAEAVVLFAALAVVSVVVLRSHHSLLFLILPLMGWAAWRFQQRGAAPAALLVASIATWAADHGWGPFAQGTLFGKMLTLQAFNATVAFTSFVFAALVAERARAREALLRSAHQLEERVRQRTGQLRQRERQLAEAQQVARFGSWEWVIQENRVSWSDEMYRIYGHRPQAFPVTFEKAIEQVVPEDVERIQRNVTAALASGRDQTLPSNEYRIIRPDGAESVLLGKARLIVAQDGRPLRMVGTVQDVTEEKQAEREHRIAETLQRSLLPEHLPEIPGVGLAARYVPATKDVEVGGDWYDVILLPNGTLGVAIGDVAGHGLRAASTMGQLRMALRAYAIEEVSPATVIERLARLSRVLGVAEMATLVYLVFDPDSCAVTFSNAGHPPPLFIPRDGEPSYLEEGLTPPVGASVIEAAEGTVPLPPGSTLLLFTDGLIERRGTSLRDGMARLQREARSAGPDLEGFCDSLLSSFVEHEVADDVAILAFRPLPLAGRALHFRVPAEPRSLAPLRHSLRRWLREIGAGPEEGYEILVACGEACANAIQHPYGARSGSIDVDLDVQGGAVDITVRDGGNWRSRSPAGGGHGLQLMRGMMDSVDVQTGPEGTVVRMRRRIGIEVAGERARTR
ncbi:MAG: PAS domain S-box protein [Actinobacteria bacterium]|nr:MAG: PAS domain S-box protein [Actinomycetota bacterium]